MGGSNKAMSAGIRPPAGHSKKLGHSFVPGSHNAQLVDEKKMLVPVDVEALTGNKFS